MIGFIQYLISTILLILYAYKRNDTTSLLLFVLFYIITNIIFKIFGIVPKELNKFYAGLSTTLAGFIKLITETIIIPATRLTIVLIDKILYFPRTLIFDPITRFMNSLYKITIWLTDGTAQDYAAVYVLNIIAFILFQFQGNLNYILRGGFKLLGMPFKDIKVINLPDSSFVLDPVALIEALKSI